MPVGKSITVGVCDPVCDPSGGLLKGFHSRLLVSVDVELDEQEQVAG